jgi:serine/arginine repetitive matrix protein 1
MVDSLAMFFGARKRKGRRSPGRKVRRSPLRRRASPLRRRRSPVRKVRRPHGVVVVKGRERKLYKGKEGGLYYRTKSGKHYVDAKFIRAHKSSPKRKVHRRRSPVRHRRRSPVRHRRRSPVRHRRRASPMRRRRSPMRMRRTRWGYGLGQPSLIDMMGPAGLTVVPRHHRHHHSNN